MATAFCLKLPAERGDLQARSRELYDVLNTSFGAREELLFITISEQFERTAAVGLGWGAIEQKQSICRNGPLTDCRNGALEIRQVIDVIGGRTRTSNLGPAD